MRSCWAGLFLSWLLIHVSALYAQVPTTLIVEAYSGERPIEQVEVSIGDQVAVTDSKGEAILQTISGETKIHIERFGFSSKDLTVVVAASAEAMRIRVELAPEITHTEEITVTATRSET